MARTKIEAAGAGAPRKGWILRQWERIESTDAQGIRTAQYLLILSAVILTCFGMVMVLSSSAVEFVSKNQDPFVLFLKQSVFGLIGLVGMFVIMAMPTRWLRKLAWSALMVSGALLILVLFIGKEVLGNKNWIEIGPISIQPSEFAKFALILWAATVLGQKRRLIGDWKHALIPVVFPGGAAILGLVVLEHDLGTVIILALILAVMLWVSGAPRIIFGVVLVAGVAGILFMAITSGNRMGRITEWWASLTGGEIDAQGTGLQALQGRYALASGGWFGVGLGQSRLKWSYVPEAQNDFILSIIGEELGLIGSLAIVALFLVMAVSMYRIAHRSRSIFVRVATAGVIAWIIGQAFVNMGMVTGLLPVIGVPLPFISYGGSALLTALCGVGLVLNFARDQIRHGLPASEDEAAPSIGRTP
ncbi:putative lipid II flippase FtsW [Galactobacter valiniphilus]|uniref:Probable peptidoglycan glycosyltransferase FtsW n=1 Tax=Galactobacter valiniphilus TaxID=2676122 RepID=A0A399JFQ3_9MICC|nr:putative lipid II flippase FtsW [Galactobacter valiniphilus]RII42962.1 putative lipid II flippase FtsW [Galactobacter valiniphilus]